MRWLCVSEDDVAEELGAGLNRCYRKGGSHSQSVGSQGAALGEGAEIEGVVCEDDVFLGPSMVFTNVINPRSHVSRKEENRATLA